MTDFYFIGEDELLVALRLVGVAGKSVSSREEALSAFLAITGRGGVAGAGLPELAAVTPPKVLILSSEVSRMIEEEARAWQLGGEFPLVVEIPSPGASADEGRSLLAAIREAVGIAI